MAVPGTVYARQPTHTKISGEYIIKKRWLRSKLRHTGRLKIGNEYVIKKTLVEGST